MSVTRWLLFVFPWFLKRDKAQNGLLKITENAVAWKESVTTPAAFSINPKNSCGEAAEIWISPNYHPTDYNHLDMELWQACKSFLLQFLLHVHAVPYLILGDNKNIGRFNMRFLHNFMPVCRRKQKDRVQNNRDLFATHLLKIRNYTFFSNRDCRKFWQIFLKISSCHFPNFVLALLAA